MRRVGLEFLRVDNGEPWKYRGITAFNAPTLRRRGEHEKVRAYYEWARSIGVNIVREFCFWQNGGAVTLNDAFYRSLEAGWIENRDIGMWTHAVIFCDQVIGSIVFIPTRDARLAHVRRVVAIAKRVGTVLLEVNNEDGDGDTGSIAAEFAAEEFAGVLTTRSTWWDEQDPERSGSYLDWVIKHTDRGDDFACKGKVCHEAERQGLGEYPPAARPCASTEPRRIAEGTTPRQHADDAAVCELLGLGRCIHGGLSSAGWAHDSDLQNCTIPTGAALACCEAVGAVWRSNLIPANAHAIGRFVRANVATPAEGGNVQNDHECPIEHIDRDYDGTEYPHGQLRSYFMQMPDGRMVGLAVDPGPLYPGDRPRLGYRIVARGGYNNVLVLER